MKPENRTGPTCNYSQIRGLVTKIIKINKKLTLITNGLPSSKEDAIKLKGKKRGVCVPERRWSNRFRERDRRIEGGHQPLAVIGRGGGPDLRRRGWRWGPRVEGGPPSAGEASGAEVS